ncbi:MAG: bifunctional methylenetetrahydrofolate dehydrogenase/methenyltetrahydrofolate cyclohydrolase FolD [Psittacicella sp.]
MTAQIVSGKSLALTIKEDLKNEVSELIFSGKRVPGLVTVLVGDDPASKVYVGSKSKMCIEIGMYSENIILDKDISEEKLVFEIEKLNKRDDIDGILVQLPLPKHISARLITDTINQRKDVDCFHSYNVGSLVSGNPIIKPCTPHAVMKMIKSTSVNLIGKKALVVGASNIVGKPLVFELLREGCTVSIANSKTINLSDMVLQSDIVIAAVGKKHLIQGSWIKDGAIVIDVGINRGDDKKIYGDVDFDEASKRASFISPVPGGVGPMTIMMLMYNTLELYKINNK